MVTSDRTVLYTIRSRITLGLSASCGTSVGSICAGGTGCPQVNLIGPARPARDPRPMTRRSARAGLGGSHELTARPVLRPDRPPTDRPRGRGAGHRAAVRADRRARRGVVRATRCRSARDPGPRCRRRSTRSAIGCERLRPSCVPSRRTSPWRTAPTTSRSWPGCWASRRWPWSTTSTTRAPTCCSGWRAGCCCPRRSPPTSCSSHGGRGKTWRYHGLKEEVYLADFVPTQRQRVELGIADHDGPVVTLRPPAVGAMYHRHENPLWTTHRAAPAGRARCADPGAAATPVAGAGVARAGRSAQRPGAGPPGGRPGADLVVGCRGVGRRHDEPGGRRARHPGVVGVLRADSGSVDAALIAARSDGTADHASTTSTACGIARKPARPQPSFTNDVLGQVVSAIDRTALLAPPPALPSGRQITSDRRRCPSPTVLDRPAAAGVPDAGAVVAFTALIAITPAMPHVNLLGGVVDPGDVTTFAAAVVGLGRGAAVRALARRCGSAGRPEAFALAAMVPFTLIAAIHAGSVHSLAVGSAALGADRRRRRARLPADPHQGGRPADDPGARRWSRRSRRPSG